MSCDLRDGDERNRDERKECLHDKRRGDWARAVKETSPEATVSFIPFPNCTSMTARDAKRSELRVFDP